MFLEDGHNINEYFQRACCYPVFFGLTDLLNPIVQIERRKFLEGISLMVPFPCTSVPFSGEAGYFFCKFLLISIVQHEGKIEEILSIG